MPSTTTPPIRSPRGHGPGRAAAGWLARVILLPALIGLGALALAGARRWAGRDRRDLLARGRLGSLAGARGRRPLNILQVTPRYAPFVGGIETHTEEVSKRLAARGHHVTVATTDPGGTLPDHESRDDVEVVRVRAWPANRDWYFAPGLLRLIASRRWDVVHLQGVHTLVPPLGALISILLGQRFVLTFHSGGTSSRLRVAARDLQWRLIAPLLRSATTLIGVSRFEADRFATALGVPRERVALIRNGSDLPPETAGSSKERAARTARTGARSRLVLSLGRLERYKGHQRVIAAMPAIRRMRPGARLRIAGRGDYEPELRQLVDDMGLGDVVTIGAVPHEDMPDTLAEAGVVALLSEYEAHPVAVMEALAARRRVVVADTTGFSELAEEGLVRAIPIDADPEVAAAAIVEEMDRPEPAEAPDLPSWDDTTDALEDLYLRVAAD